MVIIHGTYSLGWVLASTRNFYHPIPSIALLLQLIAQMLNKHAIVIFERREVRDDDVPLLGFPVLIFLPGHLLYAFVLLVGGGVLILPSHSLHQAAHGFINKKNGFQNPLTMQGNFCEP